MNDVRTQHRISPTPHRTFRAAATLGTVRKHSSALLSTVPCLVFLCKLTAKRHAPRTTLLTGFVSHASRKRKTHETSSRVPLVPQNTESPAGSRRTRCAKSNTPTTWQLLRSEGSCCRCCCCCCCRGRWGRSDSARCGRWAGWRWAGWRWAGWRWAGRRRKRWR